MVPPTPGFFKRSRKDIPEPKPQVDIATALPSSDDFRTSLLMPNLSARFSMLREQDDPNSKIGKANDDSVLFPKRASRLNLFTHNPLTDIAEVSSIDGSIRPPFTLEGRTHSYASLDGYVTDDDSQTGSMMSRSKPGEGNNLFGGRQKIYKIPVGGITSSRDVTSPTPGKAVYGDDVHMSAFQKLKQQEREEEQRRLEQESSENHQAVDDDEAEPASSPVTDFSKNRGTSSSTTSGPSNRRTSTAATSIDSQPPTQQAANISSSMVSTKARRMYGHGNGPDQTMSSQQPSALTRLETLSRQRAGSLLSSSKSMGNLNDRYQKSNPVYTSAAFRTASPPPSATPPGFGPLDSETKDPNSHQAASKQGFGYVPPLSPPISEGEDAATFVNAVQPEDRGKATAMGLFNKPSRQYDEQQFSQRQVQMHEGRNTPTGERSLPSSTTPDHVRPRNQSNASYRSRADSSARGHAFGRSDSRQAASEILEARLGKPSGPQAQSAASEGTFLEPRSDPSSDAEDEQPVRRTPSPHARRPPSGVHPALRSSSSASEKTPRSSNDQEQQLNSEVDDSPVADRRSVNPVDSNMFDLVPSPTEALAADSPTLGPGLGLSGLIRTHLRTDSDKSSILPPPLPKLIQLQIPSRTSSKMSHHTSRGNSISPRAPTAILGNLMT